MSGYVSGRTSLTTVQTADLADNAVTSAKINDDAVTSAKINDSALNDNIFLNGTNSSSANAGSDLILDASAAGTDVGSRIMYEDGSTDNNRFIDSVNEKSQIALVDKILLNGYASGAGDGDALLFETASGGGFIEFDQISTVSIGGDVQGDVAYNDGYGWTSLPPGTSGHFLKTQGASAIPAWAAAGGGGLKSVQFFGTGSNTWTKPAGLERVWVWVQGAGGGGSGISGNNGAGGGGGGGCAFEIIETASLGATETCTGGVGGAGGASGGNNSGSSGGASSFGSHCSAGGGAGGSGHGNPGGAGAGSGGDVNIYGSYGSGGHYGVTDSKGGSGGSSFLGGGGGSWGGGGSAGLAYGGGGAGGQNSGGAAGYYGCVVVWEFY